MKKKKYEHVFAAKGMAKDYAGNFRTFWGWQVPVVRATIDRKLFRKRVGHGMYERLPHYHGPERCSSTVGKRTVRRWVGYIEHKRRRYRDYLRCGKFVIFEYDAEHFPKFLDDYGNGLVQEDIMGFLRLATEGTIKGPGCNLLFKLRNEPAITTKFFLRYGHGRIVHGPAEIDYCASKDRDFIR